MAINPSLIGQLIAGRYRVVQRRGVGAHGVVVDALDEQDQRVVVIKILMPQFAGDTASEARFRLEAQVAASFSHPNLNAVLDWGVEEIEGAKVPFLALEKLPGGSLRDMIDRGRLLTPSQALIVGLDVCRGLDAMHRRGVIHRDLRPANIAFGEDRHAQILDVGISRYVAEVTWSDPSAAGIDAARYASPEQARGATPAAGTMTSATDIYALALVLIESVTGQVPFVSDSTVATLNARLDRLMPVSADFGPLASVLSRAGSAVASDRYTAAELGRALVQAAGKLPRPTPLDVVGGGSGLFGDGTGGTRRPIDPSGPMPMPTSPAVTPVTDAPVAAVSLASAIAASPPDLSAASVTPTLVAVPGPPSVDDEAAAPPATITATSPVMARFDPQTGKPLAAAMPATGASVPANIAPAASAPADMAPVTPVPAAAPAGVGLYDFSLDDDVPPSPGARRRKRVWAAVAIVIVAALVAGAFVVYGLVKDATHTVPDLAGLTEAVARNRIAEDGWTVVVTKERSDQQVAGNIIRTDPGPGVKLAEGKSITLVVSDGATLAALPDVTGLTLDAATALLAASHLDITVAQQVNNEQVPDGAIISWTVPAQPGLTAGAEVMQATVVAVVVSQGPAPRQVPSLIGLDLPGATAALAALQLGIIQAPDVFSHDQPIGAVAEQSAPVGSSLARGESVTVALSKGQDLVAVPALGGLAYTDIEAALTAAGLRVGKVKGNKDTGMISDATVGGVSLVPGQQLERDTKVDLVFVDPPPTTTVPPDTVPVSSP
ncbi:MAG: putative serine/threonine protein kinase [Acidimicrobiales bacterium]|nr:putative serine/threonine protein kinase [Acidimicrobiales bacterium]